MNSKKSKKSQKPPKVPQPMKIKKEGDGLLNPMSFYLDDRVELVKQVFSALKPKTIKNLAPEFLKKSELEEIEELCLNELLGISTKRLKSIIEGTQCPSDTESSSDSDVNNIDEHISLEEISSDTADESSSKIKKLTKKKNKKAEPTKPETGEMSVLELLELQARARAIRSQLALEPITKIEVDSGDSEKEEKKVVVVPKSNGVASTSGAQKPTKRIKLKRNFGRHLEENADDKATDVKIERSPSPDVVTIVQSPETLCISDSSSEEEEKEIETSVQVIEVEKESDKPEQPTAQNTELEKTPTINPPPDVNEVIENPEVITEPEEGEISDTCEKEVVPPVVEKDEKEIQNENTVEPDAEKPSTEQESTSDAEQDDQNDDVISLEGGDLVDEMREHLEEEKKPIVAIKAEEESDVEEVCEPTDVITLDDSSDEEVVSKNGKNEPQSWNSRWLNSSKVSKVLATSRLGNRVREKIKKTKSKEKDKLNSEESTTESSSNSKGPKTSTSSKFEDGSLDQYKELLQKIRDKHS